TVTAPPTPAEKPTVVAQAKAPVQAQEKQLVKEKESAKAESLVAPPPVTVLREFEDPRNLPTPGAPYNEENTNPHVVMRNIPKEATGVEDWVKAFKENVVQPHESLDLSKPPVPPFNFDVEIPAVGSMPNVIFPHFPHTFWLDCGNCHPAIFIMKKGGNPISMVKIVNGEFCGRCHGRVAFPIANCTRCHVKPKQ
ncbi:MAG: c(7)-type cytochrome triheme domain-containing protein, partial [Nitrospiria bacterium]